MGFVFSRIRIRFSGVPVPFLVGRVGMGCVFWMFATVLYSIKAGKTPKTKGREGKGREGIPRISDSSYTLCFELLGVRMCEGEIGT